MKQIRRGVFETNSSSTHSVSITGRKMKGKLPVDQNGYVYTSLGEFGWEVCDYRDAETKLSYLLTMAWELNGYGHKYFRDNDNLQHDIEEFVETRDFQRIERAVCYETGCDGVWLDDTKDGYIDHQSCEGYNSIDDFLNDWGTDIEDFIFNKNTVLHTDNDNHF